MLIMYDVLGHAWITPEKMAIRKAFHRHIMEGRLPSFQECRDAIHKYSALRNRKVQVIKAHVNNELNRKRQKMQIKF